MNLKSLLTAFALLSIGVAISLATFFRAPKVYLASAEMEVGQIKTTYLRSVRLEPLVPLDYILKTKLGLEVGTDSLSDASLVFARRLPRVEIVPSPESEGRVKLLVYGTSAAAAQEVLTKSVEAIAAEHKAAYEGIGLEYKRWTALEKQCQTALQLAETGKPVSTSGLAPCFLKAQFESAGVWQSAQSVELTPARVLSESPTAAPIRSHLRQHLIVGLLLGGALLGAFHSLRQLRRARAALPA